MVNGNDKVTVAQLKNEIADKQKAIDKLTNNVLDANNLKLYESLYEGITNPERKRNKLVDVEINVENKKTIKVSEVLKIVSEMKPTNTKEQVDKLNAEIAEIKDKIISMV